MIVVLGSHKRKVREKLVINKGVDPSITLVYRKENVKWKRNVKARRKQNKTKQSPENIYLLFVNRVRLAQHFN